MLWIRKRIDWKLALVIGLAALSSTLLRAAETNQVRVRVNICVGCARG